MIHKLIKKAKKPVLSNIARRIFENNFKGKKRSSGRFLLIEGAPTRS